MTRAIERYEEAQAMGLTGPDSDQTLEAARDRAARIEGLLAQVRQMEAQTGP